MSASPSINSSVRSLSSYENDTFSTISGAVDESAFSFYSISKLNTNIEPCLSSPIKSEEIVSAASTQYSLETTSAAKSLSPSSTSETQLESKSDRNSLYKSELIQLRAQIVAYRRLDRKQDLPAQLIAAISGETQSAVSTNTAMACSTPAAPSEDSPSMEVSLEIIQLIE